MFRWEIFDIAEVDEDTISPGTGSPLLTSGREGQATPATNVIVYILTPEISD